MKTTGPALPEAVWQDNNGNLFIFVAFRPKININFEWKRKIFIVAQLKINETVARADCYLNSF